jgi:orotate phosphoribosyltransferase
MKEYKKEFIDFSLKKKALNFGNFILKSGRKSPYFFNSSSFYTGKDIEKLAYFYYCVIINYKINFNHLFGLAYKGIPIAVAISLFLKKKLNLEISYSFNRKENKKHGEYGNIVGKYIRNSILIDDVITSGISIKNFINNINKNNHISSVIVALDRKEIRIKNIKSINQSKTQNSFPIFSIITIKDLIQFLIEEKKMSIHVEKLIQHNFLFGTEKINF